MFCKDLCRFGTERLNEGFDSSVQGRALNVLRPFDAGDQSRTGSTANSSAY